MRRFSDFLLLVLIDGSSSTTRSPAAVPGIFGNFMTASNGILFYRRNYSSIEESIVLTIDTSSVGGSAGAVNNPVDSTTMIPTTTEASLNTSFTPDNYTTINTPEDTTSTSEETTTTTSEETTTTTPEGTNYNHF